MIIRDYYLVLGIKPTASNDEVRAAYVALAKRHHPDWAKANLSDLHLIPGRLSEIQSAYRKLSNQAERQKYDQLLADDNRAHIKKQMSIQLRLLSLDQKYNNQRKPKKIKHKRTNALRSRIKDFSRSIVKVIK